MACPSWFKDAFNLHCDIAALTDKDLAADKLWVEVWRNINTLEIQKPDCPVCNEGLQPLGPPNKKVWACRFCESRHNPHHYLIFTEGPQLVEAIQVRDLDVLEPNKTHPAGFIQRADQAR